MTVQLSVKMIPLFKKSSDPSVVNITSLGAHFLNRAVCEFSYAQSKAAGKLEHPVESCCIPGQRAHWGRGTLDQVDVCRFDAFQD